METLLAILGVILVLRLCVLEGRRQTEREVQYSPFNGGCIHGRDPKACELCAQREQERLNHRRYMGGGRG